MKRSLLYLFLLSCSFNSFTQIFPFEDYAKCLQGFKTSSGDTVWSAKFEQTEQVWGVSNSQKAVWKVKEGGLWGVLDFDGKVIAPANYHDISPTQQGSLVVRAGSFYGVLDYSGNWILPMEYSSVVPFRRYDRGIAGYQVSTNNGTGYADSIGKIVIPLIYQSAFPLQSRRNCPDVKIFFQVTTKEGKTGILNYNGEVILKPQYEYIQPYFYFQKCEEDERLVTVVKSEKGFQLINLLTGKRSAVFKEIAPFDKYAVYQKGNRWGILDENFNKISREYSGYPSTICPGLNMILDGKLEEDPYWYFEEGMDPYVQLKSSENVIFTGNLKYKYYGKGRYRRRHPIVTKFGLLNFRSDKKIPIKYDLFRVFRGPEKNYYWGIKREWIDQERYFSKEQIDIYNQELELQHSYTILNGIRYPHQYYWTSDRMDTNCIVLQTVEDSLFGLYDYSGKKIVPPIYNSHHELRHKRWDWNESKHVITTFHSLEKNGKYGLFSNKGEKLFDVKYKYINVINDTLFQVTNFDDVSTIYDHNRNVLVSEVSAVFKALVVDRYGRSSGDHYRPKTTYVISNGMLKILENGEFVTLDEKRINFKLGEAFQEVIGYLVNRKGEVLIKGRYRIQKLRGLLLVHYPKKDQLDVMDAKGNIVFTAKNYAQWAQLRNEISIRFNDKTNCILDVYTGKPIKGLAKYKVVVPFHHTAGVKKIPFLYWVKSGRQENGMDLWMLVNRDGQKVADFQTEYPTRATYGGNCTTVRKKGQYALLDHETLEIIDSAYFDYVFMVSKNYYIRKKNGKWGLYGYKGLSTPTEFDTIVFHYSHFKFIVMKEGKMGILGSDLNYLVPLSEPSALIENYDLPKIYGILSHDYGHRTFGIFPISNKPDIYRKLRNRRLIEWARANNTSTNFLESHNGWPGADYPKYEVHQNYTRSGLSMEAVYSRNTFFSEKRRTHYDTWQAYKDRHKRSKGLQWLQEYKNYQYFSGSWKEIGLNDLIQPTKEYVLDEMIVQEITKAQSFGLKCINTAGTVSDLKRKWLLTDTGIRFHGLDKEGDTIEISYSKLKSILNNPQLFN